MTTISLPWPYTPGVGPTYSADDWANVWSWLGTHDSRQRANTGVLGGRSSFLTMNAGFPTVLVWPGAALVGGRFVQVTHNSYPGVSAAHPTYKRIDLLVLRTHATNQTAEIAIKEGTPGPAPVAPTPVQDGNPYYELPLYELHVRPGATYWKGTDFVDVRRIIADPASVFLDVWLKYGTQPTVEKGAPVFASSLKPVASTDGFPFMPIGLVYPSEFTRDTPLLGVAAEKTSNRWVLPVLARGFTTLTMDEAITAGEMVVVTVRGTTNTLVVGRAPVYDPSSAVKVWKPLGIALTSADAGEQCLVWVDPLSYRARPAENDAVLSGDFSTTSTTPVTVTGVGVQNLLIRTPRVAVAVAGQARHSAAGGSCTLTLMLDSYPLASLELGYHQLSVASQWQNISIERVFDWSFLCYQAGAGLKPGDPHSLWLQASTSSGTLTLRSGLQLRVRESTPYV
jgi:hypothetical protein